MVKRNIIRINEELCDGCGQCITACAEGALQMVNGKARLVSDVYCDGLGACIGECPTGALTIEEREAIEFDEQAVMERQRQQAGQAAGQELEMHTKLTASQCPGNMTRSDLNRNSVAVPAVDGGPKQAIPSELAQWPVQLQLVNPQASFFEGKEVVLMSPCSPVASADLHWRFIRGRALVLACPKLDNTTGYVRKLSEIIDCWQPPVLIVLRMEVPCCAGLTRFASEAVAASRYPATSLREVIVGVNGDIGA